MKKFSQITFTFIILIAFNMQVINAQVLIVNTLKATDLENSEIRDITAEANQQVNEAENNHPEVLKNFENQRELPNFHQLEHMNDLSTDLDSTDEEEQIQVENWMLDPCEWLCKK